MATTQTKRRKISMFSVLSLIMTVLPVVIDFLSRGEPNARIDLVADDKTNRIKAVVSTSDEDRTFSKSAVQKPL